MIIAYHAIFTTYGSWLPNDPRGSYSPEVYAREIALLGKGHYGLVAPVPPREVVSRFLVVAAGQLKNPPYVLGADRRELVATGFGRVVDRLQIPVIECAIMSNHVHVLVWRTKYRIEYIVNKLKGAATVQLGAPYPPWTRKAWNVFLDNDDAVEACAEYVRQNPDAAGLPPQQWEFVKKFLVRKITHLA
jgi:REP element-mobilizing transposase RayT